MGTSSTQAVGGVSGTYGSNVFMGCAGLGCVFSGDNPETPALSLLVGVPGGLCADFSAVLFSSSWSIQHP